MKFAEVVKLMLKEEYRFHTTYTSRFAFLFFPILITVIGFFASAFVSELAKELSILQLKLSVSIAIFFYGLVAGAFGFLGKESIKRFSGLKFLVHSQECLPLKLRTMFISLYFREILFYLSLTVIPLTLGLLIYIPLSNLQLSSVLIFFVVLCFSFIAGISFSYFIANLYRKCSKFCLLFIILSSLLFAFLAIYFKLYNILLLTKTSDFISVLAFILFNMLVGTIAITEETEIELFRATPRVQTSKYLDLKISPFLAKEFLDLKRSNALPKILFSFLFPLIFLSLLFWFIEKSVKVGFSSVTYALFISFFCLVIYSWLNNIESFDFYNSLSTIVPQIIKLKLRAHLFIASVFVLIFVVLISSLSQELHLLPVALLLGYSNLIYISFAVAYLTGLRVNAYLFDPTILVKFCIFALLPQIPLSVLSFAPTRISIAFIVFISLLLLLASNLLFKALGEKWKEDNFEF